MQRCSVFRGRPGIQRPSIPFTIYRVEPFYRSVDSLFSKKKYNRLTGDQQALYIASLEKKAAKLCYRAWNRDEVIFVLISKKQFEEFSLLLKGVKLRH